MIFFDKLRKPLGIFLILIIITVLTVIEVFLRVLGISLTVFFLLPVILTIWWVGWRSGIAISILSAAIIAVIHITHASPDTGFIHYWHSTIEIINLLIVTFVLVILQISWQKERTLSRTDYLTGATNRRLFYEVAEHETNRARRFKHPLSFVYLDIDDFKEVNDRWGHHQGDLLLRFVAETIRKNIRAVDTLARIGGDEFALILPVTGYDEARDAINRLYKNLNLAVERENWKVSFSVGAVTYQEINQSVDEMIKEADRVMYLVKKGGKNNFYHELVIDASLQEKKLIS